MSGSENHRNRRPNNPRRNHLRRWRTRSGLSQRDVGFLLARGNGNSVYCYERFLRVPNLKTAIACQIILGAPIDCLFPDMCAEVEQIISHRAHALIEHLRNLEPTPEIEQKIVQLKKLAARNDGAPPDFL